MTKGLGETKRKILEVVEELGAATYRDILVHLAPANPHTVSRALTELVRQGLLHAEPQHGRGRGGKRYIYYLVKRDEG